MNGKEEATMCIVFLVLATVADHRRFRLTLAANRDEYAARPTRPLTIDQKRSIGGRDLLRGGTWLGVGNASDEQTTRFAVLTNVRVPEAELRREARTRGDVCRNFLESDVSLEEFGALLLADAADFDSFNVVFGDVRLGRAFFFTNHRSPRLERLATDCVYAVTNDAQLVTPWPKAERGRALFARILATHSDGDLFVDPLFDELLADAEQAPAGQLPVTGVEPEVEQLLSSIHVPLATTRIAGAPYGTVSAVVLVTDGHGLQFMQERSFAERHRVRTLRRAAHLPRVLPSSAEQRRTIVVGDVHGAATELLELLEACGRTARDRVVLLGDLIGKGPRDADVVRIAREEQFDAVMGNWDYHVLRVWRGEIPRADASAEIGASFDALREADFRYLDRLPYHLSLPEYGVLVVHAGVREGVPLERQVPFDMMNMRTVDASGAPSKAARGDGLRDWAEARQSAPHVVFGHDATRRLQRHAFATGIDTGAVYGGELTALVLPERLLVSVKAFAMYSEPSGGAWTTKTTL